MQDTRSAQVIEHIKTLVLQYIRGELTSEELRARVASDERLAPLIPLCPGRFSFPQELLEAAGLSAYDSEIHFDRPPVITREGLKRNLLLAAYGRLSIVDLCTWSTDRIAWDICKGCEDEIVEIVADEFAQGEDYGRRILTSKEFMALLSWHLDHTPCGSSSNTRLGIFIAHHLSELSQLLADRLQGRITSTLMRAKLNGLFSLIGDRAVAPVDQLIHAIEQLADLGMGRSLVADFWGCVARTPEPNECAQRLLSGRPFGAP